MMGKFVVVICLSICCYIICLMSTSHVLHICHFYSAIKFNCRSHDVLSKICTPSPATTNATTDDVPSPTICAPVNDDSCRNDRKKMSAMKPNDDTKYAHNSKCPREWRSDESCTKKQATKFTSRHTGTENKANGTKIKKNDEAPINNMALRSSRLSKTTVKDEDR